MELQLEIPPWPCGEFMGSHMDTWLVVKVLGEP